MESLGETGRGAIAGTTTNLICLAALPLGAFSPAKAGLFLGPVRPASACRVRFGAGKRLSGRCGP
jgi:hypothetical protein